LKKQLIWVGLVLWIVGAFVGRWGLVTSSVEVCAVEQRSDDNGGSIDKGGWMAFGLAVQEICVECTGNAGRERWNGGENGLKTKDRVLRTCVWWMRELRCEVVGRIISEKRLIRYYVFGLCKMLD